jgi:DNA-binding beta-propeller fold protein YncE
MAADGDGNLYVGNYGNSLIKKLTKADDGTYTVNTLAGSSVGFADDILPLQAKFSRPTGMAIDGDGNLYVVDLDNKRIRKLTKDEGYAVSTLAGTGATAPFQDGPALGATFYSPYGLAVDGDGNVYVADLGNNRIRKLTKADDGSYTASTLAGTGATAPLQDGPALWATFNGPVEVAVDGNGNIYVTDLSGGRIRKIAWEE